MNGTPLDIKKVTSRPCKHIHVSGRRCGVRVFKKKDFCLLHSGSQMCSDCRSMMNAFQPLKGW